MGFKMKGFTYPGVSPAKKTNEVSKHATKTIPKEKKEKSSIDKTTDIITKPTLYKGKKLTLKGKLSPGEGTEVGWDTKGKLTPYGSPTIDFKNKAGLTGQYKLSDKATLSGGVTWATNKQPRYNVGLNIKL